MLEEKHKTTLAVVAVLDADLTAAREDEQEKRDLVRRLEQGAYNLIFQAEAVKLKGPLLRAFAAFGSQDPHMFMDRLRTLGVAFPPDELAKAKAQLAGEYL